MMTISINAEACAAIETAFAGDWSADLRLEDTGAYSLTLPDGAVDLLRGMRAPADSYSDVILRLARSSPWQYLSPAR